LKNSEVKENLTPTLSLKRKGIPAFVLVEKPPFASVLRTSSLHHGSAAPRERIVSMASVLRTSSLHPGSAAPRERIVSMEFGVADFQSANPAGFQPASHHACKELYMFTLWLFQQVLSPE